jgi:hypothetical protein
MTDSTVALVCDHYFTPPADVGVSGGQCHHCGTSAWDVIERQQRECKWFGEVMAVMHRDGGHYLGEHGPEKTAKDALTRWYEMKRELEARDARIAVLVGALETKDEKAEWDARGEHHNGRMP